MAGHLIKVHIGKRIIKPHQNTWRLLVKRWADILNKYLKRENEEDIPQWHIERSHTGFLAAAVWTMGGVALEEYAVERRPAKNRRRRKAHAPGRCDLYFNVSNLNCSIEAKHDWAEGTPQERIKRIKRKLNLASKQLQDLHPKEQAEAGMAVCWVVPYLKSDGKNHVEFLKEIAGKFEDDTSIVAIYHVPIKEREYCEDKYDKGHTYPGVIWVGRQQWA